MPDDVIRWVALSLIPGVGSETYRQLLQAFGEPENIFSTSHGMLSKAVGPAIASRICDWSDEDHGLIATTRSWLGEEGNHIVTLADESYPRALFEIHDPPPLLYVKGRVDLLNHPALAIIGSRNATPQGNKSAEAFGQALSNAGLTIVSGMALGIDASAHKGGLAGQSSSVAIVGTGLDIIYPARNKALAHQLASEGTLVSEYPLGTPSKPQNFPRRNRIISGLSRGCLVVEAALQSGSLITARLALEQGREVFAVPGSIHSPVSKGCHQLIKQGAKLVESAQDILEELKWASPAPALAPVTSNSAEPENPLLKLMGFDPVNMDMLIEQSGLTAENVYAILLEMELAGQVANLPGGLYQRIQ